jgi:homoserine dehydrogenase
MVPADSMLANVDGAMNAISVTGNAVGPTLYYGAGAGEMPTASAVVADLMEIAREIRRSGSGRVAPLSYEPDHLVAKPLVDTGDLFARCYLRFTALDQPGVLSHITGALGERGVGIESIFQEGQGEDGESVPVVMLTHPAREASVREAIAQIDQHSHVTEPTRLIRIEEEL